MIPEEQLNKIIERFEFLEAKMNAGVLGDELIKISKEYSDLREPVDTIRAYRDQRNALKYARDMLSDPDMKELASMEIESIEEQLPELEHRVKLALLPKDEADNRAAILEIRAGTGGDEAALFAGDLMMMYERYAAAQGWKLSVVERSENDLGGIKQAVINITGEGVFAKMKYESGVHRVQRVPETESGGRIHTSAATVAVLPEAEEVEIEIKNEDIRIDTMRSSGAGGQHVNTTDSAVRITHLPTGIVVTSSEKSQHQNREIAMRVLKTRLFDKFRQEADEARSMDRKTQVGSGDRSERIRTYNFPQGRVSDHRINLTLYKLDQVLSGELDEFIDALTTADQAEKLAELGLE